MLFRISCMLMLIVGLFLATPGWPAFQEDFHLPGPSSPANAALIFDDGSGPRLFVGVSSAVDGKFGGVFTWDGAQWTAIAGPAGGLSGLVRDLEIFDDGSGPALWAVGELTQAGGQPAVLAAKWDGADWTVPEDLAATPTAGSVQSAAIFDDGTGSAIYLGGRFGNGGAQSLGVRRWTGTEWLAVGPSFNGSSIDDLLAFDDGEGTELYAVGTYNRIGSQNVSSIAKWDGADWMTLPGEPGTNGVANNFGRHLTLFDAGDGLKLWVSGIFRIAGGLPAEGLAAWDGSTWTVPDLGIESIRTATAHDFGEGDGEVLLLSASKLSPEVMVWDGTTLIELPDSVFEDGNVTRFFSADTGTLVASGQFDLPGDGPVTNTAEWRATGWSTLTDGSPAYGLNSRPQALGVFDDGTGPALYVGGSFSFASAHSIKTLARWTGAGWEPVEDATGQRLVGSIYALKSFPIGGVDHLIIAGGLRLEGTDEFGQIMAWDGANWEFVLQDPDGTQGRVETMEIFDSGSGPELYFGGSFRDFGPAAKLARFDGTSFTSIPGPEVNGTIRALRSFNGELWVGGDFSSTGFVTGLSGLARWNGVAWFAPTASLIGPDFETADVQSLELHDAGDGQGEQLYVAGAFARSGVDDAPLFNIARWDETLEDFEGLGAGVRFPGNQDGFAQELLSFDPGDGPSLFALGYFSHAGTVVSPRIARWKSGTWQAVGGPAGTGLNGPFGYFPAIQGFDDGAGQRGVFMTTDFSTAGGLASDRIAYFRITLEVFADGFENGDLSAWGTVVPSP